MGLAEQCALDPVLQESMVDQRRRLVSAARGLKSPGLLHAWRSWGEMVDKRRQLRNVAARMRSPGISHAVRRWRKLAVVEFRRAVQSQRSSLEQRLWQTAEDKRHLEIEMASRDDAHARETQQLLEQVCRASDQTRDLQCPPPYDAPSAL